MRFRGLLILIAFVSLFTSCISNKELVYMQNQQEALNNQEILLAKQQPPYRVQINDILSIRIKALDQALVGMFNPVASEDNIEAKK